MAKKWYVVHTQTGYEEKAKEALLEKIKSENMEEYFDEILVPQEEVVEIKKGEKVKKQKRIFPGYILVKMEMNDRLWHFVRSVPKITGFVGKKNKPIPIPDYEAERLIQNIKEGNIKPQVKVAYEEGSHVRVTDGPFQNFTGVVDEINLEKGKVRVLVSIFGRSTPVELEFNQVEKI